jgi:hypothetical protein
MLCTVKLPAYYVVDGGADGARSACVLSVPDLCRAYPSGTLRCDATGLRLLLGEGGVPRGGPIGDCIEAPVDPDTSLPTAEIYQYEP